MVNMYLEDALVLKGCAGVKCAIPLSYNSFNDCVVIFDVLSNLIHEASKHLLLFFSMFYILHASLPSCN